MRRFPRVPGCVAQMLPATMLSALMLASCDPPPETRLAGAAIVDARPVQPALPPAVSDTLARLSEIAENGSYRDMASLAALTPGFRSNDAGWGHEEFWYLKLRAGDWPMAQMQKILAYRGALIEVSGVSVYVWPYMAVAKPDQITRVVAHDIDDLVGPGQAEAMRAGQPWQGYSLGVREDGAWLFFVSGAG